jgi:heme/copper-type cytochrome/quinol oxidase subunit 3
MNTRPVIDVSELHDSALDHQSPIWWGNTLMIAIETTMFVLLIATYFYLRQNFNLWPPPRVNWLPAIHRPLPSLFYPTLNVACLLGSLVPMWLAIRAAEARNEPALRVWLALAIVFGLLTVYLRFHEFSATQFKWDDNAYASIFWTILGMHLGHIITGTAENSMMLTWALFKPLDDKHVRDIRVTGIYWSWVVGIWIPMYAILFLGPRFF